MTTQKLDAFFSRALEKTKSGELNWKRGIPRSLSIHAATDDDNSFSCDYGKGQIAMIRHYDGDVSCHVKPDPELSWSVLADDDEEEYNHPSLLRLHNYVYQKFPSLDSYLDEFIGGN